MTGLGKYQCRFCKRRFSLMAMYAAHFATCPAFEPQADPETPWKLTRDDYHFLKSNRIKAEGWDV